MNQLKSQLVALSNDFIHAQPNEMIFFSFALRRFVVRRPTVRLESEAQTGIDAACHSNRFG